MFPDTLSDRPLSSEDEPHRSLVETLGSSGEGIVLLNEDLEVTWANRAAADVFGTAVETMIGRRGSPTTDPAFRDVLEGPERLADTVREASRNQNDVGPLECRVRPGKDRVGRRLLYRSEPIREGPCRGGRIERYTDLADLQGSVPTGTTRNEPRVELKKFKAFFEAVPDPAWMLDADGVVEEANQVLIEGLGCERNEVVGCPIDELPFLSEDEQAAAADIFARRMQGERFPPFSFEYRKPDGSKGCVEINARVLKDDDTFIGEIGVARDVTEQERAKDQLRESEERFRQLATHIREVFWLTDLPDGDLSREQNVYVSPVYEKIWGRSVDELNDDAGAWLEAVVPEDRERVIEARKGIKQGDYNVEYRITRPDGEIRWIHDRGFPVADEDGHVERIAGLSVDITDRKRRQLELETSREKFRTLFDAAPDPAYMTDAGGTFREINRAFLEQLGYDRDEIIGRSIDEVPFLSGEGLRRALRIHGMRLRGETIPPSVLPVQRKDGETLHIELHARVLREKGEPVGAIGVARDITERKRRENELKRTRRKLKEANRELKQQSREDALTGLANKRRFNEILDREWARARREEGQLSLLMADLDDFKGYNDAHGHEAGDDVLRSIGDVCRTVLKRPGDVPARWGGEEFAVILPGTNAEGAAIVAEKLRRAVENLTIRHADSSIDDVVTLSLGTATLPATAEHAPTDLVKRADAALYRSKDRGKNCVTTFDAAPESVQEMAASS